MHIELLLPQADSEGRGVGCVRTTLSLSCVSSSTRENGWGCLQSMGIEYALLYFADEVKRKYVSGAWIINRFTALHVNICFMF